MFKERKYVLAYVIAILSIFLGIIVTIFGFNDTTLKNISYNEEGSKVNYKVFLKENDYFTDKYLGEGETYITSLIDYININYNYAIKFSEKVSGDYTYNIVATILANKKNGGSGSYWHKDYKITEEKTVHIDNQDSFLINEETNVKYGTYNQILGEFKKEYEIDTDGVLKVSLVVKNKLTGEIYKEQIGINSSLDLSIPLLEKAVNANISISAPTNSESYTTTVKKNILLYTLIKVVGLGLIIFGIVKLILTYMDYKRNNHSNKYIEELNKILANYDSIIASVVKLPELDGVNIVDVTSFEELLDVYNEVRMPINHCHINNYESVFIIINDKMAWRYIFEINSVFKPTGNTEVLSLTKTITDEPIAKLVEPEESKEEIDTSSTPEIIDTEPIQEENTSLETKSIEEHKKDDDIEVLGETQKIEKIVDDDNQE